MLHFIPTSILDVKYILIHYEKFQSPSIYLACHWLKNKTNPIFNLFVLKFEYTLQVVTFVWFWLIYTNLL
jgi:hypothetical protein